MSANPDFSKRPTDISANEDDIIKLPLPVEARNTVDRRRLQDRPRSRAPCAEVAPWRSATKSRSNCSVIPHPHTTERSVGQAAAEGVAATFDQKALA